MVEGLRLCRASYRIAMMFAALCLAGVQANAHAQDQDTAPTVQTRQGALRGTVKPGVEIFKGIPFARPPVGPLRWRPPVPAGRWSGVRDASAPAAACVQSGNLPFIKRQSEDCLYLNVWRPAGTQAGARLPVMVWIHGGGFVRGTGAGPQYDGSHVAQRGVIQVSFNYRLGRLGFFAHPALTAENPRGPLGNYGLMDQIQALKWVKANIAAFGGDPGQVTIFGESAGGMSVNDLMVSPAARGLFVRAIVQSGGGRADLIPIRGQAGHTAEGIGMIVANRHGITGKDKAALAALRALPPEMFTVDTGRSFDGEIRSLPAAPMIDGRILPEAPMAAFAAGREAKVPYIIGANSFEASLVIEATENPEAVLERTGARDKVLAAYGGDVKRASQNFTTESMMVEPARALARLHARNGQKTWLYHFSYVPKVWRDRFPGLPHAGEIPYVFNTIKDYETTIEYGRAPPAAPEDLPIADAAITYWTQFGKHGDPGSVGGLAWPQITPATDDLMEFAIGGPRVVRDFHKDSLDLVEQLNAAPRGP
jgi:para-nitrobenzyl esterase